jgi:hypothetical protein
VPVTPLYKPRQGDIGLTQISGYVGKGIRFAQWLNGDGFADYEHAFTYVGDVADIGNDLIVEAEPGGALLSPLSRYRRNEVLWLPCPPGYGDAVAAAALSFRGVPYSFLDYDAIALHHFHIPAPHLKAYIESSHHMICSQLCDRAAEIGGWNIFDDGRWPGFVTPGDLYREAVKHP